MIQDVLQKLNFATTDLANITTLNSGNSKQVYLLEFQSNEPPQVLKIGAENILWEALRLRQIATIEQQTTQIILPELLRAGFIDSVAYLLTSYIKPRQTESVERQISNYLNLHKLKLRPLFEPQGEEQSVHNWWQLIKKNLPTPAKEFLHKINPVLNNKLLSELTMEFSYAEPDSSHIFSCQNTNGIVLLNPRHFQHIPSYWGLAKLLNNYNPVEIDHIIRQSNFTNHNSTIEKVISKTLICLLIQHLINFADNEEENSTKINLILLYLNRQND